MDQMLHQRLDILVGAGEISEEVRTTVAEFTTDFENKYNLELTEENASMLITHLAMALARIKKGEKVNPMEDAFLDEVRECEIYDELPEFYKKIEDTLDIEIPESEKGFIALHTCTIVNKLKSKEV